MSKPKNKLAFLNHLTEEQVLQIIRDNVDQQFPKTCGLCGTRFNSLKEYLEGTSPLGKPHSYDAEADNWLPLRPIGTFSFSECRCGTTLALGSGEMKVSTMWQLLRWARKETATRKIPLNDLLYDLRVKIDQQALSE